MATLGAQDYELRDAFQLTGSNNAEVSMVVGRIVLLIFCSEIYGGLVLHIAFIVACSINFRAVTKICVVPEDGIQFIAVNRILPASHTCCLCH